MKIDLDKQLARLLKGVLVVSLCSMHFVSHAQTKVWQQDDQVTRKVGDVHLSMQKNSARNAEPGAFWASAINGNTSVSGEFRGACSEVISVNIQAIDQRRVDLQAFRASKSGRDAPIKDVLQVLQQALSEQCEQLQVIRVNFSSYNAKPDLNIDYKGTAAKADGWKLQDGHIATAFDGALKFEIRSRDIPSTAGIDFRGGCEAKPTLLLEPIYQNETERQLSKLPTIQNYMLLARDVSAVYAKHCPNVTHIQYALNPMPQDYLCESGECFLEAKLDKEWVVDAAQFKVKEYYRPITNMDDVAEVLAAGRFDILADYDGFFSGFVVNYFFVYSDNCKRYIRDPVQRTMQSVKRERIGNVIYEEFGEPITFDVEREHADVFDRNWGPYEQWALKYIFDRTMGKEHGNPIQNSKDVIGSLVRFLTQIREFVGHNCTADKTLTVQQNFINYARSQPPVTGKYATDKRPKAKFPPNGPSAPAFTKSYLEARTRAAQEIRELREREGKEAWEARKARAPAASGNPANEPTRATPPADVPQASPQRTRQEIIAKTRELSRQYAEETNRLAQEYQAKMRNAKTREERQALQQEFQQRRQERQQEQEKKVLELSGQ